MKLTKNLFLATIFILPLSFALNPFPGIDLGVIRLIIPILFIIWLGEALLSKKIFIDVRPRFFFFLLFLALISLSFFWAPEQTRALRKILFILSIFPIYFIAFDLFKKKNISTEILLKTILIANIIQVFIGLLQFVFQFFIGINASLKLWQNVNSFFLGENFSNTIAQYSSWLVNIGGKTLLRSFGTFPDPHLFSLFTTLSLPISWYFFKKTGKTLYLVLAFFQVIAIILSFSRSSYLSLIVVLIFILTIEFKKIFKQKKFSWLYLVGIFLISILLIPNPVTKRLSSSFDLKEGSNQGRIEMWKKSIDIIKKNPWDGVGIGNFSYHIKPSSSLREPIYAHNLFLDFGSETGLFSILLLLMIFTSVIIASLKKQSLSNNLIFLFFLSFFIFSLFETPFYSIRIFPLFLIFLALPNE